MKRIFNLILILTSAILLTPSCARDWLDVKRNKKQFVPTTLDDAQAILDNFETLNTNFPIKGEVSTTDITMDDDQLTHLYITDLNAYLWKPDIFADSDDPGWNLGYERIFYANTAMEVLDKISEQGTLWNNLYGIALFHRAWNFFHLMQLFSPPYGTSGDDAVFGIPLKLTSNIYEPIQRAKVDEAYEQILEDLYRASEIITEKSAISSRPDKRSVHGLLAKTYLIMGEYEKALEEANQCLYYGHALMDYKEHTSSPETPYPFPQFNEETIFYSQSMSSGIFYAEYRLDEKLYDSYEANDLRRELFWNSHSGKEGFAGSYSANMYMFNGIAYDELFLIRAECNARIGKIEDSLADLNYLLSKRYDDTFVPLALSGKQVLERVLQERRKQLLFRSIRWSDLRRLYTNHGKGDELIRVVDGQKYVLEPGDRKYTLPIPKKVVELSGVEQYPRE